MVGGMVSAAGAMSAAEGAASAQEFNAAVAGRNAVLARESAQYDATIQDRRARQQIGQIRAAYGAAGVEQDGSALDVLMMSVTNAELDRQMILHRGELKALGYEDTRTLSLFGADSARELGQYQAVSSLLTGTSGAAKLFTSGTTAPSAGAPVAIS